MAAETNPAQQAEAQSKEPEDRSKWGRIFIGNKISELNDVESVRSRAWDEKDENQYLDRVRVRATEKAKEILAQAESEAAAIREQARQEGYDEGVRLAEQELEELRSSMGDAVSAVLSSIQQESAAVTRAWRDDLAALVRISVEKAFGITLQEERGKILENLYHQALRTLESARNITVRVHPEDEAAIADIIALGQNAANQAGQTELEGWRVKGDPSLTPGGLIVESASSLADNSIESRMAAVQSVLDTLMVPEAGQE
ncbi:flagellar assembly protein FliH [Desulfovibrio sp. OttesenSCG-928-C06]|nr:flagellar assembly protein FliH [Desulfovibrio sp. OttesenSCG-928-C06]